MSASLREAKWKKKSFPQWINNLSCGIVCEWIFRNADKLFHTEGNIIWFIIYSMRVFFFDLFLYGFSSCFWQVQWKIILNKYFDNLIPYFHNTSKTDDEKSHFQVTLTQVYTFYMLGGKWCAKHMHELAREYLYSYIYTHIAAFCEPLYIYIYKIVVYRYIGTYTGRTQNVKPIFAHHFPFAYTQRKITYTHRIIYYTTL